MAMTIRALLQGQAENHLMPFFWQHGEEESVLRTYMEKIHESGCGAVCVESRPHPDFCGPQWWHDMDIILDEARTRGMQVWILDDSHFPTGFANGRVKSAALELHRQSITGAPLRFDGPAAEVSFEPLSLIPPSYEPQGVFEKFMGSQDGQEVTIFDDDQVLALTAFCPATGEIVSIPFAGEETVTWQKPEGSWIIWIVGLSRNAGVHRDYMNMMDPESCRLLLEAVYEPHWDHYKDDFGTTIAGFFSDEPELGNGHLFWFDNLLGTDQDLPFSRVLPADLEALLGPDWASQMFLLWENDADSLLTAKVRTAFMDAVTLRVREAFSRQVGDWCRDHGVQYIGHLVEDDNVSSRTGPSLGHYFRGLDGQDMAGIDDIGGQVLPQGEEEPSTGMLGRRRDGTFYHFFLGALGASAATIEPRKKGNAMCEIFGAYGWGEGPRMEKYLADHFMVRGINYFVPHAFSPAPFPDPDCPPHFYAHGHNPQFKAFGALMQYMNRVCSLISGGTRIAEAAVLYHGDSEWAGDAMLSQVLTRPLYEAQIAFDLIPCDVFAEPDLYRSSLDTGLRVNDRAYKVLLVPEVRFLPAAAVFGIAQLLEQGYPVYFVDRLPEAVSETGEALPAVFEKARIITVDEVSTAAAASGVEQVLVTPACKGLRALHYKGAEEIFYLVNEMAEPWTGTVTLPQDGSFYAYDAWENRVQPVDVKDGKVDLTIEPLKSIILVAGQADIPSVPVLTGRKTELTDWTRSVCESIRYPAFRDETVVSLPDDYAKEQPTFSGFLRYDTTVELDGGPAVLVIDYADEDVEVLVNDVSLGIQVAPPMCYDISAAVCPGENRIRVEVATSLERWSVDAMKDNPYAALMGGVPEPKTGSGLTGKIHLLQ
ncbi:MAG: hypothetical protein K6A77_07040 [Clostridiales bacterium]|nr:hypothetical protein [Clostridiales bacterium]